jgi:hypothetical protein
LNAANCCLKIGDEITSPLVIPHPSGDIKSLLYMRHPAQAGSKHPRSACIKMMAIFGGHLAPRFHLRAVVKSTWHMRDISLIDMP